MITTDRHVHIVDDDAGVRRSTVFLLQANGFTTDQWISGDAFLASVSTAKPGCVLLDMRMRGLDGIAVQLELTARGITMPVIVLTGHGDVTAAIRAMKAGAVDFLEKPAEKTVLLAAIDGAFERFADRRRHEAIAERARSAVAALTPREREVLTSLTRGISNKGIAKALDISVRTVEIHRANVMARLGATSLARALRIGFAAGLAEESRDV